MSASYRCADCNQQFLTMIGLESHVEFWKQNDDRGEIDD